MKLLTFAKVTTLTIALTACGGSDKGTSDSETAVSKELVVATQVFNFVSQSDTDNTSAIEVHANLSEAAVDDVIYDLHIYGTSATDKVKVNYTGTPAPSYSILLSLKDANSQDVLQSTQMETSLTNNQKLIFAYGTPNAYGLNVFDKPNFETDDNKSHLVVMNLSNYISPDDSSTYSVNIEGARVLSNANKLSLSSIIPLTEQNDDVIDIAINGGVNSAVCKISQADLQIKKNAAVVFYDDLNTKKAVCSLIQIF